MNGEGDWKSRCLHELSQSKSWMHYWTWQSILQWKSVLVRDLLRSGSKQFLCTRVPCKSAIASGTPRDGGSQKLHMNACPLQIFPQKESAPVREFLAVKATSFCTHRILADLPLHWRFQDMWGHRNFIWMHVPYRSFHRRDLLLWRSLWQWKQPVSMHT